MSNDIRRFTEISVSACGFEGICDNCFWDKDFHCQDEECSICPGEYHTCMEYFGQLKEVKL